jgi:NAD(P)-dependent dehydrogenase (short-subunit alcohol dehydrogenase family)
VFISSGVGVRPRAYWGPYAVSKAALDALAYTYAAETVTTNVRVNLLNPGPTRTRMRATALPGEDPMTLKTSDVVGEKILELCLPTFEQTGKIYDMRKGPGRSSFEARPAQEAGLAPQDDGVISIPRTPTARRP